MTITLRPYQTDLAAAVYREWDAGAQAVVMRLDTGGGKTQIFSQMILDHNGASCLAAHRQELVAQISLTLAKRGVRHNLIAADATRRAISRAHIEETGQCYYTPGARCSVVSIPTLVRAKGLEQWASQVTLAISDEGHHFLRENSWGKAFSIFKHPKLRILLPTATPGRADGKGLGRHADGIADAMVSGPPMRWLIDQGYLTDYDIAVPPSDMRVLREPGASGDWSTEQLREAAKASHIVGDVVTHYLRLAPGRLGVTFCTDVETAVETTAAFRAAGVRAETLTGTTPDHVRRDILRRYRAREIHQLVTVDIVSEGFDLPAIEVASMARPTQSLALYMQQFGRALRPLPGKTRALIIDHASNTLRHGGPPDKPRAWTLDRREKRASTASVSTLRVCVADGCWRPYERFLRACPFCGHVPVPQSRASPAAVDGDLELLDAAVLAQLRGAVALVDATDGEEQARLAARNMPPLGIMAGVRRHRERREAQEALRASMAAWGGWRRAEGLSDAEIQRKFYGLFGLDVLSAQALGARDADVLHARIDPSFEPPVRELPRVPPPIPPTKLTDAERNPTCAGCGKPRSASGGRLCRACYVAGVN